MSSIAADWRPRLAARKALRDLPPLLLYWLLFCGSVLAFVAEYALGGSLPALRWLLGVLSSVTCGLAWLLSRELFRGERPMGQWPHFLVGALFLTGLVFWFWDSSPAHFAFLFGALESFYSMLASVVLFLIVLEPLEGLTRKLNTAERQFRLVFITGQGMLLLVCIAWFQRASELPELQPFEMPTKVVCALLACLGYSLAVRYRLKRQKRQQVERQTKTVSAELIDIADQIEALFHHEHSHRNHELKVADLSRLLHQPDYKVTQATTQVLRFRNFNQMINFHRIEDAKRRLSSRQHARQSILAIALDCGFGSIGPFNRAFKSNVGMTPSAFRAQRSSAEKQEKSDL